MVRTEQLTEPLAYHGEGPVRSEAWGGLRRLDMLAGDVLSLAPDGTVARRHIDTVVAAVRPRRRGGAVIGVERGFALEDTDGTMTILEPLWSDDRVRMNEGGCDPDGRFHCGSAATDGREGTGSPYRLDPDGSATAVLDGVTVSNGLAWSPDGSRAHYADTATDRVDVLDHDREGGPTGRRPFVVAPAGPDAPGRPDGLTVDAEGGVGVALYDGGAVHRYAPDGTLDEVVELPVTKATACTFGGPALDRPFITTSREHLPPDAQPRAGALFTRTPGVRGRAVREFAG